MRTLHHHEETFGSGESHPVAAHVLVSEVEHRFGLMCGAGDDNDVICVYEHAYLYAFVCETKAFVLVPRWEVADEQNEL